MRTYALAALIAFLVCLASCHATGPISAPVAAGAAAMIGVFDQLLAGGVIDPLQHHTLVQGVHALDESVMAVSAHSLSPETATAAAGGLTAAILGGIRVWRGPSTKGASAS